MQGARLFRCRRAGLAVALAARFLLAGLVRYAWTYNDAIAASGAICTVKERRKLFPRPEWRESGPVPLAQAALGLLSSYTVRRRARQIVLRRLHAARPGAAPLIIFFKGDPMLKMKTRLRAAALALSLAGGMATNAANASPVPDYAFVHVTGTAYTAILPDIATLDFEIVAADADPAAARAVLETRVGEVRALMQHLTLDPEDVVVREVRQTVRKGEQSQGGAAAAGAPVYELRCDVKINVRNVSSWPALAGGLFGKPNLDGFASSFDSSAMDKTVDELVTQAVLDARRRAEVIAAAGGRRLGAMTGATPDAIKNLSTAMGLQRDEFRMPRRAGAQVDQQQDREQLMSIQAIKLQQPVDVIFRLENLPAGRKGR